MISSTRHGYTDVELSAEGLGPLLLSPAASGKSCYALERPRSSNIPSGESSPSPSPSGGGHGCGCKAVFREDLANASLCPVYTPYLITAYGRVAWRSYAAATSISNPVTPDKILSLYPDRHLYAKLNSKVNKCHDFEHRLYHLSSAKTLYFLFDLSSILFPCLFGPMTIKYVVFSLEVVVPISAPKRQHTWVY